VGVRRFRRFRWFRGKVMQKVMQNSKIPASRFEANEMRYHKKI
jgi:hypothetical protein